jgi:hypothetical protein
MTNPYYTNLRRPASQDFQQQVDMNIGMQQRYTGNPQIQQGSGNWFENNQWATQDSSGVGQWGAAAASMMPNTADGQFSVDKNAGFKGSFQGLASGGVVGAIAGGIGSQLGEAGRVKSALNALDTSVQGVQYDGYGRPVYGGASVATAQANISELNKGAKSMSGGLDPATWVFNARNRRRIRKKKQQLKQNVAKAQQGYNSAAISNQGLMNNLEDYNQRMDASNKLYNVYKTQF